MCMETERLKIDFKLKFRCENMDVSVVISVGTWTEVDFSIAVFCIGKHAIVR